MSSAPKALPTPQKNYSFRGVVENATNLFHAAHQIIKILLRLKFRADRPSLFTDRFFRHRQYLLCANFHNLVCGCTSPLFPTQGVMGSLPSQSFTRGESIEMKQSTKIVPVVDMHTSARHISLQACLYQLGGTKKRCSSTRKGKGGA